MIGTRIGPYEVTGKLGEGGMGEVYRATDTKLHRDVAIKVLPAAFTEDRERLQRFEREAQLLAQLHHPNIASIFGLEDSGSTKALVMELVEGPTLADRLAQGSLAIEESLSIARQIAEALEEAHEKGIVHRDLKPQNIKASLDGKVKVLDFGLAKAMDPVGAASGAPSGSQLAASPTLTLGATVQGVILGTAAYMSPEQAKGLPVDKRADVWAFGVVLYEMLIGGTLFAGDTVGDTLAAVIRKDIDLETLPEGTPPALRRLLRRCLERNPKNRLHSIADARILIDEVLSGPAEAEAPEVPPPGLSRRLVLTALAATLAIGALVGGLAVRRLGGSASAGEGSGPPFAFRVTEPAGIRQGALALSPDGHRLVYPARGEDGNERLWVRDLGSFEPRALPGSEGGQYPFFSPDGRDVAFEAGSELRRVPVDGGAARTLVNTGGTMLGGAWGVDGTILLGNRRGVLQRVSASGGGQLVPAVERPEVEGPNAIHAWPSFLPDGRRFVYLADGAGGADGTTHRFQVGSLDGGPVRTILADLRSGLAVDPRGFLLVVRNGQLIARQLDARSGELVGEPELVMDRVFPGAEYHFLPVAVSSQGTLAFQIGSSNQRLDWVDSSGRVLGTLAQGEPLRNPRLSPDGRFVAFEIQYTGEDRAIWVLDIERGVRTLLSERGRLSDSSAWSPDSRWVYFDSEESDAWHLLRQPREGAPDPEPVLEEPVTDLVVQDVSPDGQWILFTMPGATSWDLHLAPTGDSGAASSVWLDSRGHIEHGRFSPDGRWIAYSTDESGRSEV